MSRAEEVANAVLYEGYMLYPYRPSAIKNQQRWNFGVVYPADSSEGSAIMETQCLAMLSPDEAELDIAELDVRVRFLQLTDGGIWQQGVEREISMPGCRVKDLLMGPMVRPFEFPAENRNITGSVEVSAEVLGMLIRFTIRLRNLTASRSSASHNATLLQSLVSAHKILTLRGGEFISLIDPPEAAREAVAKCRNTGTFPVLAGEEGRRDVMLSSPIILYDYPQIAPESAGDLCDGTEIDEILSLRILTLTDDEKREMRESDERGRRILERTEGMPQEQWMKLHGILRGLRPNSEWTQ